MNLTFALMTASVYLMSCLKSASPQACPFVKGEGTIAAVVLLARTCCYIGKQEQETTVFPHAWLSKAQCSKFGGELLVWHSQSAAVHGGN